MKAGYLLKQLLGTLIFFGVIFVSAGTLKYTPGIIYAIIGIIMFVLSYTLLMPGKSLIEERSKPGEGVKKWDKVILGLFFLSTIAMYTVAGFDSGRYNWSPGFHWILTFTGALFTAIGQLLFLVAQKQNSFFSSTVRIQTDRGHKVCSTGLYKIVRHPAYSGSIIQAAGFPLLFSSLWSIIPATALIILHIIRTYLEDKTLSNELPGYREYSETTKARLVPFIW